MFPNPRGEEPLARGVEMNSCPLFDQHADLAQFVLRQTVFRAVALAHGHPIAAPWCARGRSSLLANRANRRQTMIGVLSRSAFRVGTKLRQCLIELVRKLYQLAYRGDRAARALRSLPGNVRDDLHSVRNAFRPTYLLFGS